MKLNVKILIEVAACLVALALSSYLIMNLIYADFAFSWAFWIVPACFLIDGFVLAVFVKKHENTPPKVGALLLVKMLKFISLIAFALIAILCCTQIPVVAFVVFFAVNYIFYLLYESIILIKLNKNHKK
ncbi:MAG: hypothetical protein LBB41_04500 [Prevotellaceae bacterium]|jgi:hypothetical protein|nr:hypothetical protein [Prevotellaceae bacterium]